LFQFSFLTLEESTALLLRVMQELFFLFWFWGGFLICLGFFLKGKVYKRVLAQVLNSTSQSRLLQVKTHCCTKNKLNLRSVKPVTYQTLLETSYIPDT